MSSLTKRCMASIESLLSYSTQPAYTELDLLVGSRLEQDSLSMQDYGLVTETTLTMDDFQSLPSDQQSDQIFKLLAILSPLANEVCDLKCSIGEMLSNNFYFLVAQSFSRNYLPLSVSQLYGHLVTFQLSVFLFISY